jgi:hypothetical protein
VFRNVLVDDEGGGPSVATVEVTQSPNCPNYVTIDGLNVSNSTAPLVRLIGMRTAASGEAYPVGFARLSGLQVFSGARGPVLEVAGNPGSWGGVVDLGGVGGTVTGDAAGFTVIQPPKVAPAQ